MATRQGRLIMASKKSKLPAFRNDHEERRFWSQHSIEEFADELEDLDVVIQPTRTEQIALRLTKVDLETLRTCAKQRGVGHTTLARSIVEQWLARSRQKSVGTRSSRFSHAT
jgi:predicted DNA binding CopG/RHH family protein